MPQTQWFISNQTNHGQLPLGLIGLYDVSFWSHLSGYEIKEMAVKKSSRR